MNYLHVIEILNKMEKKVIEAKLITYTQDYLKKWYNRVGDYMQLDDLKGLYIAHRGIQTKNTIENTVPAFSLALERRVPIELDLHILKDGTIVVFHDHNLKRLFGTDREISSYSYEELKELTFPNTRVHIPLFEDILRLVSGKVLLVIEIKETKIMRYSDYCKRIVSILNNYPYNFVVKSFDIRIVHWFLKHTSYITGLLIANRKGSFYDFLMQRRRIISWLRPDFLSVDYHIISDSVIQDFRKKKPILVWTIRDLDILNRVEEKADSYLIEKFYF